MHTTMLEGPPFIEQEGLHYTEHVEQGHRNLMFHACSRKCQIEKKAYSIGN